jgi:hypothetical protein
VLIICEKIFQAKNTPLYLFLSRGKSIKKAVFSLFADSPRQRKIKGSQFLLLPDWKLEKIEPIL